MAVANLKNNPEQAIATFRKLSIDDQLALLWYVYEKMGDSITPAAPGSASSEIAERLFEQVKQMSHPEQLEVMRNIAAKQDTLISREYGSLGRDTKLAFWYLLSVGMDEGTVIPMPSDYNMAQSGQELLEALEDSDFEEQITFLRNSVLPMGAEPKGGSEL
jgi:hypothetical protein